MSNIKSLDELKEYEWCVSWSGGKDSTATILKMYEYDIPIKNVIYVRLMFNNYIPASLPIMTRFVDDTIDRFNDMGINTVVIYPKLTAIDIANKIYKKSKFTDLNGNKYGMSVFTRQYCKLKTIKIETLQHFVRKDEYHMLGYTIDEKTRILRLNDYKQSILCTLNLTQRDSFKICNAFNMLSPLYNLGFNRDGCFFCPNAKNKEREYIKFHYPYLFTEIQNLIKMCNYDLYSLRLINNWIKDYYKEE